MAASNPTPDHAIAQEFLRRSRALASMQDYREYISQSGHADFAHPPQSHHEVIIAACERLLSGASDRVLIMAPPGSAKSTYSSIQFATYFLAKFPALNILCCSNTTELAEEFNRRRRACVQSAEWQALSGTTIDPQDQGVSRFSTAAGGTVYARGVGSSVVGVRSDLNLLDDPIASFADAMSETALRKQSSWYDNEYRSRLKPTGKELIITTRWSRNDIAGVVLDRHEKGEEHWDIVRLPMLADSTDDPVGRAVGEPLWPEWFTEQQVRNAQRDPLTWNAMYQQTPLNAAGSWVPMESIQVREEAPENLRIVVAMDLALTVKKGDFTVFVVAGVDENRCLWILDVVRNRDTPDESVYQLFRIFNKYSPSQVLIDDDPAAKAFTTLFYELARKEGKPVPLRPMKIGNRDKETRAAAIRGYFMQNAVFIKEAAWNTPLIEEIMDFPSGSHDDQIDCLSLLGRALATTGTPIPPPTRRKVEILGVMDENFRTRMSLEELHQSNKAPALRLAQRRRL